MAANKDKNVSIIRDIHLLSALLTLDPGLRYSPRAADNGKIHFEVHGTIADTLERLHAGESAPLVQYMANLKKLHSLIFDLKNGREQH